MSTIEEKIIFKMVNQQPYYKSLVKDYTTLFNNLNQQEVLDKNVLFEEYKKAVFKKFADDLGGDIAADPESIMMTLEHLNLVEYLNA